MKWALGIVAAALIGWLVLTLTTHGVLVWSERHRPADAGQDVLTCSYFTGLGIASVDFWYSPNNIFGRAICPRLRNFSN
jgi:hypothetical protein